MTRCSLAWALAWLLAGCAIPRPARMDERFAARRPAEAPVAEAPETVESEPVQLESGPVQMEPTSAVVDAGFDLPVLKLSPAALATLTQPDPDFPGANLTQTAFFGGSGGEGNFSVNGAMGFTFDPDMFLMTLAGHYEFADGFNVGPLVQYAVSDDLDLLAGSVNFQYLFDTSGSWRPYAQAGIGILYLDKGDGKKNNDDDDYEFSVNVGMGLDYDMGKGTTLGTGILFNILGEKLQGERVITSIQLLTFRYIF